MESAKFSEFVNAIIKTRRGTEAERSISKFSEGELVYTVDKKRLYIGDDTTTGGTLVGNKTWYTDSFAKLSQIQKYDLVFLETDNSFYLLTGSGAVIDPANYALIGGSKLIPTQSNTTYTLPAATIETLGGIKPRDGLKVINGLLYLDYDPDLFLIVDNKLTLRTVNSNNSYSQLATYNNIGTLRVQENAGLILDNNALSVSIDNNTIKLSSTPSGSVLYVKSSNIKFPTASVGQLGVVQAGYGLSAANDGTLSVSKISASNIDASGATNGQVLTYNNSTSTWVPSSLPTFGNIVVWVNFDGTRDYTGASNSSNTNRFIRASNNVSNVLRNGTGDYTIFFTNPLIDANYCVNGVNTPQSNNWGGLSLYGGAALSTNAVRVMAGSSATGSPDSSIFYDGAYVCVSIIR